MGDKSKIEWTDATWNPVTGCTKVSQGCKNCYAERLWPKVEGARVKREGNEALGEPRPFTHVRTHPERLDVPLHWKKPRRIFVNSMSDLFHEDIPRDFLLAVWNTMRRCPRHVFQILSKRAAGMKEAFDWTLSDDPLPNVHLGISCEDQATFDERWPYLRDTPAAVRFISYEPALGPLDADEAMPTNKLDARKQGLLDWLICGGESGPGPKARPMYPDWARSVRDQCAAAGVPFFFKQWGEWAPGYSHNHNRRRVSPQPEIQSNDWVWMTRVGKKAAGAMLDGREWKDFPK